MHIECYGICIDLRHIESFLLTGSICSKTGAAMEFIPPPQLKHPNPYNPIIYIIYSYCNVIVAFIFVKQLKLYTKHNTYKPTVH